MKADSGNGAIRSRVLARFLAMESDIHDAVSAVGLDIVRLIFLDIGAVDPDAISDQAADAESDDTTGIRSGIMNGSAIRILELHCNLQVGDHVVAFATHGRGVVVRSIHLDISAGFGGRIDLSIL